MLGRFRGDFLYYSEGLHHGQADPTGLPARFRDKVLELARSGRSVAEISRQFDVSRQTIMNWIKQDDADSGRRSDILNSDERKELTRLPRENKRLLLEQEVLSKAAAWFAREADTIPKRSSDS
jgi:transposase